MSGKIGKNTLTFVYASQANLIAGIKWQDRIPKWNAA